MATYKRCDRCGVSTEQRIALTFYVVSCPAPDAEIWENPDLNKEICRVCRDALAKWLEPMPSAKST
jgi:hypothetical protein